jgi:mRNA interferase RelE/StbE
MKYSVVVLPSAERDLTRLPTREWKRVRDRIDNLASRPRGVGSRKLHGMQDGYRLRCGDYRVLYRIDDAAHEVFVYAIGNRKDVYR